MRIILFILSLLLVKSLTARQLSDTIPGPFTVDNFPEDGKYMVISLDAKKMFVPQSGYVLHVDEARFENIKGLWTATMSPDLNTWFKNERVFGEAISGLSNFPAAATAKDFAALVGYPKSTLPFAAYPDTNYILGIHPNGQLLVTKPWFTGLERAPSGLKGLWLADPKTGKRLKTLRTDTIMRDIYDNVYLPQMGFNCSYTAFLQTREPIRGTVITYPFGTDSIIMSDAKTDVRQDFMADAHYIYEATVTGIDVYSLHTGKLLYRTAFATKLSKPAYLYRRNYYTLQPDGTIYRLDREEGKIYKEIATDQGMQVLQAWSVPMDQLVLGFDQRYVIGVAGDRVFMIPTFRRLGSVPGNAGYVISLRTGKVLLTIDPFFNPSEEILAREKAYQKDYWKMMDRVEAEKQAKACEENAKRLYLKGIVVGNVVKYGGTTGILKGYDCKTDEYLFSVPGTALHAGITTKRLSGYSFREGAERSRQSFPVCVVCKGEGLISVEVTKDYTKEVPQGYFSGIKTTITKTWTETEYQKCQQCKGSGINN